MNLRRAECVLICTSGSVGRAGETDQPKGGDRAPTRPQQMRIKDAQRAHRQAHGGEAEARQCLAEQAPDGSSRESI
jgi:hypothetical protein